MLALIWAASAAQARPPACLSECMPRIGIVSAFGAEADLLLAQTQHARSWQINGNRFTTGVLRGNRVVIVLSGVSMVNAAMLTQVMLDHFRIERLILSGIAGGVDPAGHVGDVLVPQSWIQPMEVYWNGDGSVPAPCSAPGDIACLGLKLAMQDGRPVADFRLDTSGETPRATGMFVRETFVMNSAHAPQGEFRLDFPVDPDMFAVAQALRVDLLRCGPKDPGMCVSSQPVMRTGGRAASGTAFLANPAYRHYLHETWQVRAIDMETAALAQVAYANHVPFIAMRSLSDLAGGQDRAEVGAFFGSGLAETNEARVTLAFLDAWCRQVAARKPAIAASRKTRR